MRALVAALVFTLAIAVTASVFAIWPVVADAPWEDEPAVVEPVDKTAELRCEGALSYREATLEALGAIGIRTFSSAYKNLQAELANAQREISHYC